MTTLEAAIRVRRTTHPVEVELTASSGDVVAVIGPNGSGKTTVLRALAGLVATDAGSRIVCDGQVWADVAGSRAWTPQQRNVGMVFQDHLLFPHLSALDNVAFGARSRGVRRREADRDALAWLDRLGVADLAGRRPRQLSGGQAQRVAVARALAARPRLLLLDEALSALDVGVAMALRMDLARHLADFGGISILVTHDPLDAMTMANRVVVLDEGRVAQAGTPAEVAQRPLTDHVARLVGLNVLRGDSEGTVVQTEVGALVTSTPARGRVNASFSPAAVALTLDRPTGSARNRFHGVVRSVVPHGSAVRVHLDAGAPLVADVTPAAAAELGLTPGRPVWAAVKATEIAVYGP